MRRALILGLILLSLNSCYKEALQEEGGKDLFELSVSPATRELLYHSTDTSYSIMEDALELRYKQHLLYVSRMGIRGETALDYPRKSYTVGLEYPCAVTLREGEGSMVLESFKLISLAMDYTYINNRLAYGILQKADIMPLFFRYVELRLNGESQGVYLLVEDPEQYSQDHGSEYILRRDYNHNISSFEHKAKGSDVEAETYRAHFKEIYRSLTVLQGKELYDALNMRLDLDQYFRKMGVDYLLQNGDYTDEIYFYAMVVDGMVRFRILPWDYDDIFSSNPHEVGRSWGIGTLFGERSYPSRNDVLEALGDRLIFSIEDDLDYAIAMDPFLYARYEESLGDLLAEVDESSIERLFEDLESELLPYYRDQDIVRQSEHDLRPTDMQSWQSNMLEKKDMVLERMVRMKQKLQL